MSNEKEESGVKIIIKTHTPQENESDESMDSVENVPDASISESKPDAPDTGKDASSEIPEDLEIEHDDKQTLTDDFYAEYGSEVADRVEEPKPTAAETPEIKPSVSGTFQLENAMVGKAYKSQIDLKNLKIQDAHIYKNPLEEQLAKIGLKAERDTIDIMGVKGTPLADTQGEHTFELDYSYDGKRVLRKLLTLLVNSDPKSLWKEVEPAADLPYPKPHTATQQISGDGYNIIAASRRGRSHAHEGTYRDDDFAIGTTDDGWDVLIVADGAGSADVSRRGSLLACETGIEFLKAKISEQLEPKFAALMQNAGTEAGAKEVKTALYNVLCGAAFAAYKRIEQEAADTSRNLKDFSTTFLASIVRRFDGGTFIASFGIGDGAIGVYDKEKNELMNLPDGGEFSGQTRFLTMPAVVGDNNELMRRIKFGVFKNFTMLTLMTDGISDPKFGTDNNLASSEKWDEFADDMMKEVDFVNPNNKDAAEQLCNWMDFWSQGEHDDRTLAILYKI
jgi:serine/threonine protein phosphatase PrpC